MSGDRPNLKIDAYFEKLEKWQEESRKLRAIALQCGLTEELKWGCPCYVHEKANVVLIHGFKEYCALLFFKGSLMKDPNGILIQQTENVQAGRQIRFTDAAGIDRMQDLVKAYILEAVEIEKAGLKVDFKKPQEFKIPEEFQSKLDGMPELKLAFQALTPGRQRAYILHFSGAKQSKTRQSRIEKCLQPILDGKGLDD